LLFDTIVFGKGMSMPENHPRSDFGGAMADAKKQAGGAAREVSEAAQDLYDQTRESTAQVTDATRVAARKTTDSFERALQRTVETQPYTAALIAFALGWLFGRTHRPF
jgi:ElaB/YqjD/DUF883 family membrane-anchored ribosome-binding protein